MKMNRLEKAVMDMLLAGDHRILDDLRNQMKVMAISSRQYSGSGFFLEFDVPKSTRLPCLEERMWFGDVHLEAPELKSGADFVLFVDEGCLAMLEGYTYDEPWPEKLKDFHLTYDPKPRDIDALFKRKA